MRTDRDSGAGRRGPRGREAFTLVELLVVIAIIAILAGLLMPAVMSALNRAHEARTLNLIHQCQIAATGFFNDHGDYPPSTYIEMFEMFDYDDDFDVVYGDNNGVLDDADFVAAGWDAWEFNQGIEVFLACVATRNGGPYLPDVADWQLGNTDGDVDLELLALPADPGPVGLATNWFFEPNVDRDGDDVIDGFGLMELVDWWGNPLVYVHNRDYAVTDGSAAGSFVEYAAADGQVLQVLSRDADGFQIGNPPNLNSFQLYSIGSDGIDNDDLLAPVGDVNGDGIIDYGMVVPWNIRRGVLANWEE